MNRFDYISRAATEAKPSWTNKEVAAFHYFNPNGLYQQKLVNDHAITELVNAGTVRSGWHYAHGTMSDFETNELIKLNNKNRIGRIELAVVLNMLQDQITKTSEKIAEVTPVEGSFEKWDADRREVFPDGTHHEYETAFGISTFSTVATWDGSPRILTREQAIARIVEGVTNQLNNRGKDYAEGNGKHWEKGEAA